MEAKRRIHSSRSISADPTALELRLEEPTVAGVLARQGPVRDTAVQAQVDPAVPLICHPSSMPAAESAQTPISTLLPSGPFPEQPERAI
jgi:hypothetical protein